MKSFETLLRGWINSVAVMHFAHHKAATRYEKRHVALGAVLGTALTALVGTSGYTFLAESAFWWAEPATLLLSALAGVLGAVNVALDYRGLSQRHHAAATAFQGLRREMEEELQWLIEGRPKTSYEHLRKRWTAALEGAPRLPERLHDDTRAAIATAERAAAERENRDVCLEWHDES